MKATGLAIALLFFGLGTLSAAPLDEAALARALKFGLEFKTGVISACTLLQSTDGKKWIVLDITQSDAYLQSTSNDTGNQTIYFDDMDEMSRIEKVLSYGGNCGRGGICCVKD